MKRVSSARRRAFRSRHKKKPGWYGRFFIIFAICAFTLFITAIVFGRYLGRISDENTDTETEGAASAPDTARFIGPESGPVTLNLRAGPVLLSDIPAVSGTAEAGSSAGETSRPVSEDTSGPASEDTSGEGQKKSVYNAASVLLRTSYTKETAASGDTLTDESGAGTGIRVGTGMLLCYTSPVAEARGYDARLPVDPVSAVAALRADPECERICGIFDLSFPSASFSLRPLLRDYEAELLRELADAGFDDIVLCGFDSASVYDAEEFISEITGGAESGCSFGIAMDFGWFSGIGKSETDFIRHLYDRGIFFALDLSVEQVPGLMTPETVVYDRVSRLSATLLRYGIRTMVGCGGPDWYDTETGAAVRAGAVSVQVRGRAPEE